MNTAALPPASAPAVRAATASDLPAVERLLAAADLPAAGVAELFATRPADFVLVDDPSTPGEVVGVAGLEARGDTALLRSVAVRTDWRARRLGDRLVRRAIDDAERRGLRALYLLTTTAERYFPRFGFEPVERAAVPDEIRNTVEFRSACPASAVAMRKELRRAAPFRILVLCTGNSARSQIAEALLAARGAGRVEALSAGSSPVARVNPHAVETLRAHGVDWSPHVPRSIDSVVGQHFDLVITVCDNARDSCPHFPGAAAQVHWGLPDPAREIDASAAGRAFAETYDELSRRVDALLALPIERMEPAAVVEEARRIHTRRA